MQLGTSSQHKMGRRYKQKCRMHFRVYHMLYDCDNYFLRVIFAERCSFSGFNVRPIRLTHFCEAKCLVNSSLLI